MDDTISPDTIPSLWQKLKDSNSLGYLLGCANVCAEWQAEEGILPNHAYGIIGVHELTAQGVKLLKVSNIECQ